MATTSKRRVRPRTPAPRKTRPGQPAPFAGVARSPRTPKTWKLRLYVAGQTPKSIRAFANLEVLCEKHLKGAYQIEVIDLLEHPHLARGADIVALPTLVVNLPDSVQQIIGDLSKTDRVLVGLALHPVV